jgi:hypothetical protein
MIGIRPHPEEHRASDASRRMAAVHGRAAILRGAQQSARTARANAPRSSRDDVRDSFANSQDDVALCGNHQIDFSGGANHSMLCPAPFAKIFLFSCPERGSLAIVTDVGRDAVDADALLTNSA